MPVPFAQRSAKLGGELDRKFHWGCAAGLRRNSALRPCHPWAGFSGARCGRAPCRWGKSTARRN